MGEWLVIITDKERNTQAYYGPFQWEEAADAAETNRFVKGSPSLFRADVVPLCAPQELTRPMR